MRSSRGPEPSSPGPTSSPASAGSGSTSAPRHSCARSAVSTHRSSAARRSSPACARRSPLLARKAAAASSRSSASRGSARPGSPASWCCSRKRGRRCSSPAASPTAQGVTFLPLLGALRRAEPEQALEGESDAELVLGRLAALAEGAQSAPLGESYWAVRRLLEALARTRPVLLVLDDVHWAEPALVDLVDYLADRTDAPSARPLPRPSGAGAAPRRAARARPARRGGGAGDRCRHRRGRRGDTRKDRRAR